MPVTPTYPGVYIEEVPGGAHAIEGVATSIVAFVGWTAAGPVDKATLVHSWPEYERVFGGRDARNSFGHSVSHFFANGGAQAYIVRLVAGDAGTATAAAGGVLQPDTGAFEAALQADGGTGGVNLLGDVDLFNLLCVPGETSNAVLAKLEGFCRARRAFLIVDTPQTASFASLQNGPDPSIAGDNGANAALYFPWVQAADPLQGNRIAEFPPSALVAGIYARTDAQRGVWKAPAGTDASLADVAGLRTTLTDLQHGHLNVRAINCLRSFPRFGNVVWGARTLAGDNGSDSEWKYVPVRRLALFIEESLYRGTRWAVFEPNDESLWAALRLNVGNFMQTLFRQGAFQGAKAREAYFVDCDQCTTTQADIDNGMVNIVVGFAPVQPAEFVVVTIRQNARRAGA